MFKFIKSVKLPIILLAVAILLIFLHYLGILGPIENLIIRISAPIQHQFYSLGTAINSFYGNLNFNKDLVNDNKKLADEVQRLTIENSQLKTQIQENQAIAVQADFLAANNLQAITAKIIGRNPDPARQAIILNKGNQDGIRLDFPLITAGGVMVGKISQVKKNSSEAILISDSASSIAALIQNETETKGVVVGEHGLSLKMELIPQNEIVKEGDLVVTSGLEPATPKGLVIGKISQIESEPNSFFQTARVQSLVKIDSLSIVSILISPDYD